MCADFQDALLSLLSKYRKVRLGRPHSHWEDWRHTFSLDNTCNGFKLLLESRGFYLRAGREFGASSLNSRIPLPSNEMKVGFKVMKVKYRKYVDICWSAYAFGQFTIQLEKLEYRFGVVISIWCCNGLDLGYLDYRGYFFTSCWFPKTSRNLVYGVNPRIIILLSKIVRKTMIDTGFYWFTTYEPF